MRKDLARRLLHARKRKQQETTKAWNPNDVTRPLDSWDPAIIDDLRKDRATIEERDVRPWGRTSDVPEIPTSPETNQRSKVRGKKRTMRLSVTVSEEEAEIIRSYVSGEGTTVAAFARRSMFAAMDKKIPPRR